MNRLRNSTSLQEHANLAIAGRHLKSPSAPKVFGIGVSRTGTYSLKVALESIGFGPCYHMSEATYWPHVALQWDNYLARGRPSLSNLLHSYRSACDVPIFGLWRKLQQEWPEALFILTVREPRDWLASVMTSIHPILSGSYVSENPGVEIAHRMCRRAFQDLMFDGKAFEEKVAIEHFHAHNKTASSEIARDRLLIMNIAEGWKPLCAFLRCDAPTIPFPHLNSGSEVRAYLSRHTPGKAWADRHKE